jgi:hypothetical protein
MNLETEKEKNAFVAGEEIQTRLPVRQSFSVPGKFALGASIVGALASLGGIITLTRLGISPELSTVISFLCWLSCLGIGVTRLRWTPLVSTLLSAVILFLLAMQPYVTGSLAHPKTDPNGGFGHFVGDVAIIVCGLVVFLASIAAAQLNYGQNGRQVRGWFLVALGVVAGMAIGALLIAAII